MTYDRKFFICVLIGVTLLLFGALGAYHFATQYERPGHAQSQAEE